MSGTREARVARGRDPATVIEGGRDTPVEQVGDYPECGVQRFRTFTNDLASIQALGLLRTRRTQLEP